MMMYRLRVALARYQLDRAYHTMQRTYSFRSIVAYGDACNRYYRAKYGESLNV